MVIIFKTNRLIFMQTTFTGILLDVTKKMGLTCQGGNTDGKQD